MATSATQSSACPSCGQALAQGGSYCPYCGTQVAPITAGVATDALIKKKIDDQIAARLQDQNDLVRELADKVEDVIWKRYTRYAIIVGALIAVIIGALSLFGISNLSDVSAKIDPIVNDTISKAKTAEQNVTQSAAKAEAIKVGTDRLSASLDAQTKRMTDSTGKIATKRAAFEAAQKQMEAYLARFQELSQQVDSIQKSLQTRVQQVSSQVDDVSLRQVYPDLGQKMYVTLNSRRWREKAEKGPGETWVT
jgi:uncharacterized Zn finger protein (UPF0148 family)